MTDPVVAERIDAAFAGTTTRLEAVHLKETIREVMALAQFGNRYFDEHAPWRQVKEDGDAAAQTIGTLLNLINALKVLFAPFLPFSSARLHELLGYADALEAHGWRWEPLPAGQALPKPTPLFIKIET